MSLIDKMRRQDAVYWAVDTTNPSGQPTYATPIDIKVRWEDVQEEYIGKDGTTQVSNAIVFVGLDVKLDDVLMLGTVEEDVVDGLMPTEHVGAGAVMKFEKIPKIKPTKFLRIATL